MFLYSGVLNSFQNWRNSIYDWYVLFIFFRHSFEWMLYKLELLDYKARERAGAVPAVYGVPVPVFLQEEAASEVFRLSLVSCF